MWPNPQETADLATFTEENLNGKLHFLCSDMWGINHNAGTLILFKPVCKVFSGKYSLNLNENYTKIRNTFSL